MANINYDSVRAALDEAKIGASQLYDSLRAKNYLKNVSAEEILATLKLKEIVDSNRGKEMEQKKNNALVTVLAVIGILALIAGTIYAIYCYFTPDYLDDYDEAEDELDEDFFEDELDEDSEDDL